MNENKCYNVIYEEIANRVEYLAPHFKNTDVIYGVPRGGVPVAMLMGAVYGCRVTHNPKEATMIVDDLIDSGKTRDTFRALYPNTHFVALYDKSRGDSNLGWLVFPWEVGLNNRDQSAEDIFVRLLQYVGEDAKREGLKDTPKRMMKAWSYWTQGYTQDPRQFLTVFTDGAQHYDEMVLMKDIPFYSHCEHHLAPFFGTASIAYIPSPDSVIGISKLGRILDTFAQRLQIQERLTNQVANCIQELLDPLGVGVVIKARHLCTESRGLNKQGHETITSAMRGVFKDNPETRSEFMSLTK